MKIRKIQDDISIVVSGEAGQGLQTFESLLSKIAKSDGIYVFTYSEVMSRIRGGNNSTEIRLTSLPGHAYVDRIDLFIPFAPDATRRFYSRIDDTTVIVGESENIEESYRNSDNTIEVPFSSMASEAGSKRLSNLVVLGYVCALLRIKMDIVVGHVEDRFKKAGEEVKKKNRDAISRGYKEGEDHRGSDLLRLDVSRSDEWENHMLMDGSSALGIGALAGGCNFIASYPMSPSTELLVFMAEQAEKFGIVVEQAEDEINAINMAIGSWYAGGRAIVTTSGGGYDLMTEGVSLAGAVESPVVIHLAQRPGPATGLPTRTEQADLMLALHAGHGEFPRAIFAPGDYTEAIQLGCHAFNLADRYQVPVFILTDQYLLDSSRMVPPVDMNGLKAEVNIVETDDNYARYAWSENGVSTRGIPGYGKGLVCADSDEHDEGGYITEDFTVSKRMMEKRLEKYAGLQKECISPRLFGEKEYRYILLAWGSTLQSIREAIEKAGRDDVALLHFSQVHPLHGSTSGYLEKAEKIITVENNATAQFGNYVKSVTGFAFNSHILKYDGMPFSVEELTQEIKNLK
ncbi:MAG: 2-oxoacid:acceptor oxidoreductase subunit alpha [Spirochaetota bacterium]